MSAKTTRRYAVFAFLMVAMFMVAIEATVVATAMPAIVARLGGFSYYSWVFSGFLLAQSATTVMFGKLADLYGRKPVMITGLIVFLIGSLLAGLAWSMPSLIVFRVLQGLGAGAIQPVTMTIVSDLFTMDERRRTQSYMASVWGISAIVGPLAGALIVQHISWAWVFWVNVPLGVIASIGLWLFLHEDVAHRERPVDYLGAGLFSLGVVALLLAISPPQGASVLTHPVLFAAVFLVLAPAFFLWERFTSEPMMDLKLWSEPVIAAANAATLAAGLALIGLTACLPIYIQGVLGQSPVTAGLTLTAMAVGWPIAATVSARVFLPLMGLRSTLRLGAVLMMAGAAGFPFITPSNGLWLSASGALLMGGGMGIMSYSAVLLLQASVDWSRRGAATASNVFARLLGNTLGAAVMGAILNLGLKLAGARVTPDQVRALMDRHSGGAAIQAADPALRAALGSSLHWVFLAMTLLAALTLLAAWSMPKPNVEEPFRRRAPQPKPAE
jgi:EmrB/QacA subfamily drug resistance transporter